MGMFQRLGGKPENLVHLQRIETAVRARFVLSGHDLVLVLEDTPRIPGFVGKSTVVRFWIGTERYRIRFFKPAAAISAEDLPPAWLLPSLIDDGDPDCC